MMDYLKRYYKVFFTEQYTYLIDKPIDDALAEVRELLARKKPFMSVPNITGRMTKSSFEATPVWSFLMINGGGSGRDFARITGDLVAQSQTITRIELSVRPNSIFFVFHIGGPAIAILCIIVAPDVNVIEMILCAAAFVFVAGVIFWRGAYLCKKFLRETFEEAMGITPQT